MKKMKTFIQNERLNLGVGIDTGEWQLTPSFSIYFERDWYNSRLIQFSWLCFFIAGVVYSKEHLHAQAIKDIEKTNYLFTNKKVVVMAKIATYTWEVLPVIGYAQLPDNPEHGTIFEVTWLCFTFGASFYKQ
ncbi:MAG: hypothetical protein K0R00_26 [Herbinix sp.]|jgi:hypothetical protein|nr:hypothetical protein [Herbinix sp.]